MSATVRPRRIHEWRTCRLLRAQRFLVAADKFRKPLTHAGFRDQVTDAPPRARDHHHAQRHDERNDQIAARPQIPELTQILQEPAGQDSRSPGASEGFMASDELRKRLVPQRGPALVVVGVCRQWPSGPVNSRTVRSRPSVTQWTGIYLDTAAIGLPLRGVSEALHVIAARCHRIRAGARDEIRRRQPSTGRDWYVALLETCRSTSNGSGKEASPTYCHPESEENTRFVRFPSTGSAVNVGSSPPALPNGLANSPG
jgi:hypothetical protein